MTNAHQQEIGHFVDGLSSQQRTFLQRLLGECLSVVPNKDAPPVYSGPELANLVGEGIHPLFQMLDALRCFAANDESSDIRPFAVRFPEPGHALVIVSPRIAGWRGIWEAQAHQWVVDLHVGRLTVDLKKLRDLTSSTIAWLVTLAQQVPTRRLNLVGASDQMARSIRVLRLDQTLLIVESPVEAKDNSAFPRDSI